MRWRIIYAILVIGMLISPCAWGDQHEETLRVWDCPVCHTELARADEQICVQCRERVTPNEKFFICPLCATENAYRAWGCTLCGLPFRYPKPLSFFVRWEKRWETLRPSLGEWHGMLLARGVSYAHDGATQVDVTGAPTSDPTRSYGYSRFELSWKKQLGDARLFADAFCQQDTRRFFDGAEQGMPGERPIGGVREAFIDIPVSRGDVRIGKQLWTWGKADAVHLVDVLNPDDRTDLLFNRRLGSMGVGGVIPWGETDIECAVIPNVTPTLLPPQASRFSVLPYTSDMLTHERPGALVAARFVRTDADIDWSVLGVSGASMIPHIQLSATSGVLPHIVYPQRHMLGATGETFFGDFGVRGEAIFVFPNEDVDRRVAAVLGVDREWRDVFAARDRLYMNIEGTMERVVREGTLVEFPRPFTRTLAGVVEYGKGAWTTRCAVAHSFSSSSAMPRLRGGDTYFHPEVRWEATDNLEIRVHADIFMGPRDTFFGFFRDNDRVTIDIRVTF